jgi:putative membrane protein
VHFLLAWAVLAGAIATATAVLPGMDVHGGFFTYFWIAAVFAVVNLIIGPILRFFSIPLIAITLGLFAIVINGFLVVITAWLSSSLDCDNFLTAIAAAVIISVVNMLLDWLVLRPHRVARA